MPTINSYPVTDIDEKLLNAFDCDDNSYSSMSFFLRDEAVSAHKNGTAFTRVYINSDDSSIIGYSSLKASCFQYAATNKFSNEDILHVIPAVEIARFAIDKKYQGKQIASSNEKYSEHIIFLILQEIMDIKEYFLGVKAAILFSINRPKQIKFYEKVGFEKMSDQEVFQSTENEGCIPMYFFLPDDNLGLY